MIQHRVNNNEVTTVELCDNCETYVRDLALEDYLIKDDLLEVERVGTGFMMIKRDLLEKMEIHYPNLMYKMEKENGQINEKRKKGYGFFDSRLINKEHISEDYSFCEYVKDTKTKIYINPKIELSHNGGNITFFGNYAKHIGYGNKR